MKIVHRTIDFVKDRDYVLERHCRINYECDTPWARKQTYEKYRRDWFSQPGQTDGFYGALKETAKDSRTIAEIWETEGGEPVGYLWVPFTEDADTDFAFAEVQDIYIEEAFRRRGIAAEMYRYAESLARQNGAKVLRAGTGCENKASIALHRQLGFSPYRYEFEKLL